MDLCPVPCLFLCVRSHGEDAIDEDTSPHQTPNLWYLGFGLSSLQSYEKYISVVYSHPVYGVLL